MFSFKTCAHPLCNTYVCDHEDYCFRHSANQEQLYHDCIDRLSGSNDIVDYSLTGSEFDDLTLGKKVISTSNMAWCTFRYVDFSQVTLLNSFFDFCLFEKCKFNGIISRYSVFSGSKMIDCNFSGSMVMHTNFSGIDALRCSFNDCDLYFSTFNSSFLRDTDFEDCNLKKVDFVYTDRKRVSFRYSNWEEARF